MHQVSASPWHLHTALSTASCKRLQCTWLPIH